MLFKVSFPQKQRNRLWYERCMWPVQEKLCSCQTPHIGIELHKQELTERALTLWDSRRGCLRENSVWRSSWENWK